MSGAVPGPRDGWVAGAASGAFGAVLVVLPAGPAVAVLSLGALIPLALALERLAGEGGESGRGGGRRRHRGRRALRIGAGFGAVYWGVSLVWMVPALARATVLAPVLYLGVVLVLAGSAAVKTWVADRLRAVVRVPLFLALALSWAAVDWSRGHLGPWSFPWSGLEGLLVGSAPLLAGAAFVGGLGMGAWMAGLAGLAAVALPLPLPRSGLAVAGRHEPPVGLRRGAAALGLVVWIALPIGWGWWWGAGAVGASPGGVRTVALVSTGYAFDPAAPREPRESQLASATAALSPGTADLVVWPEGAVRRALDRSPVAIATLVRAADAAGAPLVVGAYGVPAGERTGRNSVFVVESAGIGPHHYDKRRLVPLVEWTPWVPWSVRPAADLTPGEAWRPLSVAGAAVGALVCFEVAFPEAARGMRAAGAEALVVLSNDSWFAGSAIGALGVEQALRQLQIRAAELGMGAARVSNAGPSALVDGMGRVTLRAEANMGAPPTVIVGSIPFGRERTPYDRLGFLLGPSAALLLVLGLAGVALRGRRSG